MKAMAYNVTNRISIHKNKSVVKGKELRYNPPAFTLFLFVIIGQCCLKCSPHTQASTERNKCDDFNAAHFSQNCAND